MMSAVDERAWEGHLLFAEYTMLVADSSEKIPKLLTKFGRV